MQVCEICGVEKDKDGLVSVAFDRERRQPSNKDLVYTKICQHAIARGRKGCINSSGEVLDIPFLRVRAII